MDEHDPSKDEMAAPLELDPPAEWKLVEDDLAGETRDGRGCAIAGNEVGEAFCPDAHHPPPSSPDGNAASTTFLDEPTCIMIRCCGL